MISFRTHVVTLISVFLALAVGVVLGGGPLSEVGRRGDDAPDVADLRVAAAKDAQHAEAGDRFAEAAAGPFYGGRLATHQIAVITMPGVDPSVTSALGEQIVLAGGEVSVTQPVSETMLNSSEKSLVDTLGSQLAAQLPPETIAADSSTYDRIGQLLGFTLAVKDLEGAGTNAQTGAVLESLGGAELIPEAPVRERRAPLVLVVLGDEVDGDDGDALLSGVLNGLAASAVGVVVVGESNDPQLTRLRSGDSLASITSVDGVDSPIGQVAATLGLIRGLTVSGGAFGASGTDGALPLG